MAKENSLEKREFTFWEEKFKQQLTAKSNSFQFSISDDRLYPREKFLIRRIKQFISTKTKILEIGGGNFKTIKTLLDPDKYNYQYIGSDLTFSALQIGQKLIREGSFVQCNVEELPFSTASFDIILSFGVLHHTPSLGDNILKLFEILKDNGLLVLHEPVGFSRHSNSLIVKFVKKICLSTGKEKIAPMQNKLNEVKLFQYLHNDGEIISIKREYSPIRLILIRLFS